MPFDLYSTPAENYPGLDVLVLRARTATVLQGSPTLEFANGITLEADSSGGASLSHAGAGTARLATNRLALATSAGLGQMSSVAYVNAGLAIRQPGTAPAPMLVTTPPQGYFALDADVTPFRGSTLTFDARGNPQTVSGSLILLAGAIGEVTPTPPSASGASVIVQGAGATVMSGPGTYTGGTTVRDSIFVFGAGFANFSGGLYAENAAGSATGPGPVLVTSTAGASAGFDNRGLLSGNGTVAGNVTIAGGILQPGNSARLGTPVGTLTLGGNLTFTTGPGFGGTRAGEFPVDLDPQNALAALRQDVLALSSPTAAVALGGAQLGITLQSPPSPGQTFRVLTAPNSPNAVSGTFAGLASGASASATYFDVPFSFVVTYGANFVQLAHQTPPATSYAYRRLFWFTPNELFDPAVSGPLADPFGRGVSNLLAYALGEDPRTFRFDRLPRASIRTVSNVKYAVIEIRRALPLRPDLQYFVTESTGLAAGFATPFDLDAPANAARIVSRTNNGDGTKTVVVRGSAPMSANPHAFLRFSVQLTP